MNPVLRSRLPSSRMGALALTLALAGGCGLFDLREPQPPSGTTVPYIPPTEPHIVLRNLEVSAKAKSSVNFEKSTTIDYIWRFDPFDVVSDSTWTRDRDLSALDQMFKNTGTVTLTWAPTDSGPWETGRYYGNLGYRLVFRRSATDSVAFQGKCTIYLREVGSLWTIYRWADVNDGTEVSTWGYGKLNPNFSS
jgi:hypothetical protein